MSPTEKTGPPLVDVTPVGIKDYFGGERSGLTDYCFPGACMIDDGFLTQTVFIEYTSQSYIFAEYFMFKVAFTLTGYNDVYIPCQVSLTLDLMFSSAEDIPTDYKKFDKVSTRTVLLTIDWRKGLHDYCPVLFDYFHLAGVGVTIHSSLYNLSPKSYKPSSSVLADKTHQTNRSSGWFQQSSHQADHQLTYAELLFGEPVSAIGLDNKYAIPTKFIDRARHVHESLSSVLLQARDSLRTGFVQMTGVMNVSAALSAGLSDDITTIIDMEGECRIHLEALSTQLQAMWEWFCHSIVVHPNMTMHLASLSHAKRLELLLKTFITPFSNLIRPLFDYASTQSVEDVAVTARKSLLTQPQMYTAENLETSSTASVILVEPCAWEVRNTVALDPAAIQRFQTQLHPYLANKFPSRPRMSRHNTSSIHLIVCVHGLQGNQFDLRLYRSFIELALPHHKLEFLMSEANQFDTFVDFVRQTDRLEKEVLNKVVSMVSPPSKISFLAHSLGGIVVRSLVTRPSMSNLLSKLHLFLSICGPHLGTQHQNGMISAGMWLVRKWYSSQSLLQLSLKDAPSPRDSFLYQLSEAHTFDCFKHVVLLTSLQDKYVPHKSARVYTGDETDDSPLGKLSEEMANNILTTMEQAGVNLVRVTVHHALPLTADSVIGRAAHVAMLDNEHLIEKFIMCHLVQYFLN